MIQAMQKFDVEMKINQIDPHHFFSAMLPVKKLSSHRIATFDRSVAFFLWRLIRAIEGQKWFLVIVIIRSADGHYDLAPLVTTGRFVHSTPLTMNECTVLCMCLLLLLKKKEFNQNHFSKQQTINCPENGSFLPFGQTFGLNALVLCRAPMISENLALFRFISSNVSCYA
ncbi:hypothetical protein Tsp_03831 [Trichinella spiralis]|uniref:hypothetical protein n=1 Tax=Trichinella spiralis TaxID=6334 RepID=UPI0001EFC2CD|nr:hypothetical protein Tsp_03831 [Trichinella spiralis]